MIELIVALLPFIPVAMFLVWILNHNPDDPNDSNKSE
jgi:hypothetical protein